MSRNVITIDGDASVIDAIKTMLSHGVSGLPVTDRDGVLVGILSEGDFIRRVEVGTERRRGRWLAMLAGANQVALDFARQHGRKVVRSCRPVRSRSRRTHRLNRSSNSWNRTASHDFL
ncbi:MULTISPECIES: CBS domain-containing protein [Bradyrhizobium]|uniref:CBS domain-containing protein n=1 Tax=Bradyrhizobium TaxID=374 RepID=UPI001CCC8691|nr:MULTISPECIES: CBS domain-containing protein [Bradyrhizobium]MCK7667880.1 CBS domain-containing protein [Bradyrhizobium sp. 2S1]UGY12367.1 CBS domain-containing protein [Bradyrhizobium septentrionale]UGY25523.1 CBS domain-containing protein [Bradyrhizobium septentrionale]